MSRTFSRVPVVDIGPFLSGDDAAKRAVADSVARVAAEVGFLYIVGHGIDPALIAETERQAYRFFDLPLAEKNRIHISTLPNHRGYRGFAEVNNDPNGPKDIKEGFKVGRELPPDDPDFLAGRRLFGPNAWPVGLPGFRETVYGYYEAVAALAGRLYGLFALGLGLPEDHFAPLITRPILQTNLVHYPAQAPDAAGVPGIGAHSDYECFTILWQDGVGGLEVRSADAVWLPVPPIAGSFVVNIGDMMARWTNDRFASTVHRVRSTSGRRRLSFPTFCGTNYDAVITCLPTCLAPGETAKYPPVVAGEYQAAKLRGSGGYQG